MELGIMSHNWYPLLEKDRRMKTGNQQENIKENAKSACN